MTSLKSFSRSRVYKIWKKREIVKKQKPNENNKGFRRKMKDLNNNKAKETVGLQEGLPLEIKVLKKRKK